MISEIPEFDDTDYLTLTKVSAGKMMQEFTDEQFKKGMSAMLARIAVITGIELPSRPDVMELLVREIGKNIREDKHLMNLKYDEFIQAFTMAANGDFGNIQEWGKLMNIKYFRQVMNPYLLYRGRLMIKFNDWQFITSERMKEIPHNGKHKIDFRPITERAFQEYRTGKYNSALWCYQCYDDLVDAGWMPQEAYKTFETKAKQLLIGDMHQDIMKNEKKIEGQWRYQKNHKDKFGRADNLPAQLGKHIQSTTEMTMIQNGDTVELIENRAKQLCMEDYFKQQAMNGTEKLFIPVE